MKTAQRVRLVALAFAAMSVAGVMAVVACGPSAPLAPPNGESSVSDGVSVPVTEAPFLLPQSSDGGDGAVLESTSAQSLQARQSGDGSAVGRVLSPTVDSSVGAQESGGSETKTPTPTVTRDVPAMVSPKVGTYVRGYYNLAVRQNSGRGVRGDSIEFPEMPVVIEAQWDDFDAMKEFLHGKRIPVGGWNTYRDSDRNYLEIVVWINLSLLPELVALEAVDKVVLNHAKHDAEWDRIAEKKAGGGRPGMVEEELLARIVEFRREASLRVALGEELLPEPVARIVFEVSDASVVDRLVEYLRSNGVEAVVWSKSEPSVRYPLGSGTVEVDMSIALVAYMMWAGVERIREVQETSKSAGDGSQGAGGTVLRDVADPPSLPTATPEALELTQAD